MDNGKFERLCAAARKHAHAKDDILNLNLIRERRQYQQALALLEQECTPDQWAKVMVAIEEGWPEPDKSILRDRPG